MTQYRQFGLIIAILIQSTAIVAANSTLQRMVTVNADTIQIDTARSAFTASGNAVIEHRGMSASADIVYYSQPDGEVILTGKSRIWGPSQNYTMDAFRYNTISHQGDIESLRGIVDRLRITGKTVSVTPDKVTFKHATITTCEHENPDFIVRAGELQVYPQWGFFVSFDNWVHIKTLPPVWVPTFIYGSREYSLIAANANIPEFSNSQREGAAIKQRFGYFLNQGRNGVIMVGYTQALGPVISIHHLESLSRESNLQLKLGNNGSDGIEYATIFTHDFSTNSAETDTSDSPFDALVTRFNRAASLPPLQAKIGTSKGELINDNRVSKPVFAGLFLHQFGLKENLLMAGNLSASIIEETTLSQITKSAGELATSIRLDQLIPLSSSDQLSIGGFYMGNIYSSSTSWHRLFGRIDYQKRWGETSLLIGLTPKIFSTENQSPFEYQRKYVIQNNETNAQLTTEWFGVQVGVYGNYDLDLHTFRSLDIAATPVFHCWRLPLRWKTIEGQITFGVELF